ncbi:DUF2125 domain-containing protein [Aquamicrobium segne]|uniref:DUF2125 domain-containing protein n=1 Tax=Aquamicrobium segne TaxID=469547 RepID=A0ABW0GZ43_9HYPH
MTSSDEKKTKQRRGLFWLLIFLVVLFGAYSAGWFYLAGRLTDEVRASIADLSQQGIRSDCTRLRTQGYPLKLAVICTGTAYQDDAKGIAATTGTLEASFAIWRPQTANITLRGPLRTLMPGLAPLWLDWDQLEMQTGLQRPIPDHLRLTTQGFLGQTDPEDSNPVALFNITDLALDLWADDHDLLYRGSFAELDITPEALEGRTLPTLDGAGEARLKNGAILLEKNPHSLRGHAADITRLELSSGQATVSVTGPVAIDEQGLVDAELMVRITNPEKIAEILATAIPKQARKIRQGFGALAMMGKQPILPLTISRSNATLGFIPLGRIKPLE